MKFETLKEPTDYIVTLEKKYYYFSLKDFYLGHVAN